MYKMILIPVDGSALSRQVNAAQMLGSETLKVITHSKLPVLVHKPDSA